MPYFKDQTGHLHVLTEDDVEAGFTSLLPDGCDEITDVQAAELQNPPLTAKQMTEICESAAQTLLDQTAQSWGYDSLLSASSYTSSSVLRFAAEATILVAWRDQLWQSAYAILEKATAGEIDAPRSVDEFVSLLPAAPVRPVF